MDKTEARASTNAGSLQPQPAHINYTVNYQLGLLIVITLMNTVFGHTIEICITSRITLQDK